MLEELSKNNDVWLRMALQICKDRDTATDLVQEMYLKLYDCKKQINNGYIYFTIKNIWINTITRKQEFCLDEFPVTISEDSYDYENDYAIQNRIDLIQDNLETSNFTRRAIITYSIEDGLRKFSRDSQIPKSTVQKYRDEFKRELWQKQERKAG